MMNKIVIAVTVVLAAFMLEVESCTELSDCACRKVCAGNEGNKLCKRGCIVFDKFVPMMGPGVESTLVYGNRCNCRRSGGRAVCTKAAWRDNPANIPEYEKNPNCKAKLVHKM